MAEWNDGDFIGRADATLMAKLAKQAEANLLGSPKGKLTEAPDVAFRKAEKEAAERRHLKVLDDNKAAGIFDAKRKARNQHGKAMKKGQLRRRRRLSKAQAAQASAKRRNPTPKGAEPRSLVLSAPKGAGKRGTRPKVDPQSAKLDRRAKLAKQASKSRAKASTYWSKVCG